MYLLLKSIKTFFIIIVFASTSLVSVNAASLSAMVESVLESHEDIINSKKELEEASRDVTDALLVHMEAKNYGLRRLDG
jgi:hypothetical protein